MAILVWILAGLLVGYWALGNWHGAREFGTPLALGLAVGGAIAGGYLAQVLQLAEGFSLSLIGVALALLGALVVMFGYHKMT